VVALEDGSTSLVLTLADRGAGSVSTIAARAEAILADTVGAEGATASQWQTTCKEARIPDGAFWKAKRQLLPAPDHQTRSRPRGGLRYNCGSPFPWTESSLEAARGLAEELDGLTVEEREALKRSLNDLVTGMPRACCPRRRCRRCAR
jgi:hypothetical protein